MTIPSLDTKDAHIRKRKRRKIQKKNPTGTNIVSQQQVQIVIYDFLAIIMLILPLVVLFFYNYEDRTMDVQYM
jgi:hypothetical protein